MSQTTQVSDTTNDEKCVGCGRKTCGNPCYIEGKGPYCAICAYEIEEKL